MEHSELLLTAAEAFDAVGAEYAIVGGAAAIIYGIRGHTTHFLTRLTRCENPGTHDSFLRNPGTHDSFLENPGTHDSFLDQAAALGLHFAAWHG